MAVIDWSWWPLDLFLVGLAVTMIVYGRFFHKPRRRP